MSRAWRSARVLVALACLFPAAAGAQETGSRGARAADGRSYLDYYVSRYRPTAAAAESPDGGAVGGRLMWSVAPLLRAQPRPWLDRTLVGGYLMHSPEHDDRSEILRYGTQLDYIATPSPWLGRVEPVLSLAAGAVRVTEPGLRWSSVPYVVWTEGAEGRPAPTPRLHADLPDRVSLSPSVTPGIGARIRLLPGVSFRTDARQVIDFRDVVSSNVEFSGGISVGR